MAVYSYSSAVAALVAKRDKVVNMMHILDDLLIQMHRAESDAGITDLMRESTIAAVGQYWNEAIGVLRFQPVALIGQTASAVYYAQLVVRFDREWAAKIGPVVGKLGLAVSEARETRAAITEITDVPPGGQEVLNSIVSEGPAAINRWIERGQNQVRIWEDSPQGRIARVGAVTQFFQLLIPYSFRAAGEIPGRLIDMAAGAAEGSLASLYDNARNLRERFGSGWRLWALAGLVGLGTIAFLQIKFMGAERSVQTWKAGGQAAARAGRMSVAKLKELRARKLRAKKRRAK